MDKIVNQGAEAIIESKGNEITKKRIKKSYRIKEIDEKIRKLRTRSEAKMLERASKLILVPKVLRVNETNKEILMEKIEGKRLSDCLNDFTIKKQKQICKTIGENIAKLHDNNIIHGDLTTANMIPVRDKVYFIDFGLSYISPKIEDKAVDLHLLKESLEAGFANNWKILFDSVKKGYSKNFSNSSVILERFKSVEKRGRYKQSS
jgi:Kae1-associated kinase Bud32